MLNTQNQDSAYNCGRLFAVLEMIQQKALPGINATIKDKFFSSACSTPYLVFPRLLKLSQSHLGKLDKGSMIYYEKYIQDSFLPEKRQTEGGRHNSHLVPDHGWRRGNPF